MRKIRLVVAASMAAGILVIPSFALARERQHPRTQVLRVELRPLCQVNLERVDLSSLHNLRDLRALCRDRSVVNAQATAASVVDGPCGSSWIDDSKLGTGWIEEYMGININGVYLGILWGDADASWTNTTHLQYSNDWPVNVPSYPDGLWDDAHNVYTHSGYIQSQMAAGVVTGIGEVCTNFGDEPVGAVSV